MVEPIKSSSNQSGNNSKGVSFELVFSFKHGFDPLKSLILYGKERGLIEGNKTRMSTQIPFFSIAFLLEQFDNCVVMAAQERLFPRPQVTMR